MKFNGDSHFVIGGLHIRQNMPCQDHALSGMSGTSAYISLSDGCSTGGETDTGARILNYAAIMVLKECLSNPESDNSPEIISKKIRSTSTAIMSSMGLMLHDLQATLLYAVTTPDRGFVHVFGDGCVTLIYTDGKIVTYRFIWKQNMPLYISYSGKVLDGFLSRHASDDPESFVVIKTTTHAGQDLQIEESTYPAKEMVQGYSITFSQEELLGLKSIILCSDGVENFKAHAALIEPGTIIQELTSIKQWQGEFVKRRLSRMLHVFSKEEIFPSDDFSVAAIHIDAQHEVS